MKHKLKRVLVRESKRILSVTALAFFAGALFYLRHDLSIQGMPLPLITALLYATIVAPITVGILMFLPAWGAMIEYLALSRFFVASTVFYFPVVGAELLASPLLMAALIIAGGLLIARIARALRVRSKAPSVRAT
jgi:predicted membrane metal-binding protein